MVNLLVCKLYLKISDKKIKGLTPTRNRFFCSVSPSNCVLTHLPSPVLTFDSHPYSCLWSSLPPVFSLPPEQKALLPTLLLSGSRGQSTAWILLVILEHPLQEMCAHVQRTSIYLCSSGSELSVSCPQHAQNPTYRKHWWVWSIFYSRHLGESRKQGIEWSTWRLKQLYIED